MDAFSQPWDGLHLWLSPPVSVVSEVLVKLGHSSEASGVLAVPYLPLADFWLNVLPDGKHFIGGVTNFTFFSPKWFLGAAVKSKMFRGVKKWKTLAVFITSNAILSEFFATNYSPAFCLDSGCPKCA